MTNREFFIAVASANISDEMTAFANEAIAKLDKRNASRSSKPSKVALANEPIKGRILEALTKPMSASEIGEALELTTSKVAALCRQLITDGKVVVHEIKVPKKGKVNYYSVVTED